LTKKKNSNMQLVHKNMSHLDFTHCEKIDLYL